MFRSVCFLFLVSCVFGKGMDDFINSYGEKKIYESCFGSENFQEKIKEYYTFIDECKTETSSGFIKSPLQPQAPIISAMSQQDNPQLTSLQRLLSGILGGPGSLQGPSPSVFLLQIPNQYGSINPLALGSGKRKRRDTPHFSREKIMKLKDKAFKNIKMAKCFLRKYELMDNNELVNWENLKQYYSKLNVEPELKEDLLEVFEKCKQFATCANKNEKFNSHLPIGFREAVAYFKCERTKKISACLKKDLRKKPQLFDLGGLGDFLAEYDDDEKMLKTLMMDSKFGERYDAFFD